MKNTSLIALIDSYRVLEKKDFEKHLKFNGISIKDHELETLSSFIDYLNMNIKYLNYFYVGYEIPQISKEFDLLKLYSNRVINIELKTESSDEKIREQLEKNEFYLKSLGKELHLFTYCQKDNQLYYWRNSDIEVVSPEMLCELLEDEEHFKIDNIDELFNVNNYLISPVNNVQRFLEQSYFLTNKQKEVKKDILRSINTNGYSIINALPGTGKTLLLYDIAKELMDDTSLKVTILHSGILNEGHYSLIQKHNWNIKSMKYYKSALSSKPDIILIDETQRAYPDQLGEIISYTETNNAHCVISIDPRQILAGFERKWDNLGRIRKLDNVEEYSLGKSIRTNKELAGFIKGIFNLNTLNYHGEYQNISIHYFNTREDAKAYINQLELDEWVAIDYTRQRHSGGHLERVGIGTYINAHEVLGQEFNKVCTFLGPGFMYNEHRSLSFSGSNYYDVERMFFQAITRAREELCLVIFDNPSLYSKILSAIKIAD
ncbi:DUF2075 domain-containing protein [Listeria booriae]|uniref:DNA/RNA helicase domain-containing protein n=1 Tax=Listeria booriae TaxID=1552123 RepID=UPI0028804A08|nr:DNA/RNA helicase domain-containing protein [Listeria booriae]MDT0111582.1 DUF2075 domain-containing protein [Listeria booriae]